MPYSHFAIGIYGYMGMLSSFSAENQKVSPFLSVFTVVATDFGSEVVVLWLCTPWYDYSLMFVKRVISFNVDVLS